MLCAFLAAAAALAAVRHYVGGRLPAHLPFYAAHAMSVKVSGNLLQSIAFRSPRELPIYGSSELDLFVENRADSFFYHRPSGFAVFPVGRGGATCLMIQQKIAAVGGAAWGKRVVVFLSPSWFLQPSVTEDAVKANLGPSQLSAWIFRDDLSLSLKRDIARRLRDFPGELESQPLVADAARCLARPTLANRLHFALLSPLGKMQNALLDLLDYGVNLWEIVFLQKRWVQEGDHDQNRPPAVGGRIAWEEVAARAGAGLPPAADPLAAPGARDAEFRAQLAASREFDDLALLARVLRELRMDALFISQPFNGRARDASGVSALARRAYYDRLESMLRGAGYPLRDFSEYEEDPDFFGELDHPTAKAWIFYDREIDRFCSSGARD